MTTENVGSLYDDYKKNQPQPVPEGTYRIEVTGATVRNGNRVLPTGQVIGGPCADQKLFLPGQSLTENSAGIFFQTFAGFGLGEEFFRSLGDDIEAICKATAEAIEGAVVEAELVEDEYNNRPKNEYAKIGSVRYIGRRDASGQIREAGESAPAPPAPAPSPEASSPPAGGGAEDASVPAPQPVPTGGDDVPF